MNESPPIVESKYKENKMRTYACKIRDGRIGKFTHCMHTNRFYLFTEGLWKELFENEVLGTISEKMPDVNKYKLSDIKQIAEHLKIMLRMHLRDFNWSELLNLKNGMINPYDGTLLDHDPVYYSTLRMDYAFKPEDTCELWIKTITEILENDINKISILQEFFGYCLTRDTRMEKALLLLGESRSGKSTILHTLRALIGSINCSSVPLKYLSKPTATSSLMNKLINMDTDVSGKAQDYETEFKTITSGEPVFCSPKYIADFEFNPFCKLVMAANEFPRITDHSSAFYKRLILIPCNRVFEDHEINRDLKHELLKELPGILNWSIEGLKRLKERNRFEQHDFMKDAVEELREESNPVDVFLKDYVTTIQGAELEKGELYDRYKEWCHKNQPAGYVISLAKFSGCIYRKYSKFTPKDTRSNITHKRIWRNLAYIQHQQKKEENVQWQE